MRIGYDAKRLFNNYTGLGNYSRSLLLGMACEYPENEYFLYSPRIQRNELTEAFLNPLGFHTYAPDVVFNAYWRSFALANQLKKDNISLYHGLSHEIPFGIKKSGIKSIVTIHDLIFKIYPETYSFADRLIYDKKFRYSCENADAIISISESTKNDLIRFYGIDPAKIDIIPPVCNPEYFTWKSEEYTRKVLETYSLPPEYILYAGSVTERKNLISAIKAYSLLDKDYRIPFVIAGSGGSYKNNVIAMVKRLGLQEYIHMTGNIHHTEELQALYRHAKVFIFPSLYEGYGLPVMEALLCKTPVITSSVSSMPEAGGPHSYYIDPLKPEEIARGIMLILGNSEYSKMMSEKGYEYACTFNSQAISRKLMKLYKRVLNIS